MTTTAATTMGTTAWPMATGAAAVTWTPKLAEMSAAGWAARAVAAASTAAAVTAAVAAAAVLLPAGGSGMARMAATLTLAADTRSVRKHAGSWQLRLSRRLARRLACCASPKESTL